VRLPRITGLDLRLFDFDHDLNFIVFFLSADERVYGRYGGRDGKSAEGRLSMLGLRYAMNAALTAHANRPKEAPPSRPGKPILAEEFAAARRLRKGECIHCHQVNEFRREQMKQEGTWTKDNVWRYPLPENVGLTLSLDQGNLIKSVAPDTPAARSGLEAGDQLKTLNGSTVFSFADAQHALDRAPAQGEIEVTWLRDRKTQTAKLKLETGWRRTNITWRPSLLDILISPSLLGDDLSAREKQVLGLEPKQLAFRQDKPLPKPLAAIGMREEDVIVGVDGLALNMTVREFLGFLRRNYLAGERVVLNVLRDGKRIELPLTLR
jgi:serine protease Do